MSRDLENGIKIILKIEIRKVLGKKLKEKELKYCFF